MNLSKYTAQLFVEVQSWVEGLLLDERAITDKKLAGVSSTIDEFVSKQEEQNNNIVDVIDGLRVSQKALDDKQAICADAIKSIEASGHAVMQKLADDIIDPVAKAQERVKDLSTQVVGLDSELKLQLEELETRLITHGIEYEEKFVADYIHALANELLEEGEVIPGMPVPDYVANV